MPNLHHAIRRRYRICGQHPTGPRCDRARSVRPARRAENPSSSGGNPGEADRQRAVITPFYNPNGEVGSIKTYGSSTAYNTTSDETPKTFLGALSSVDAKAIIQADPVRRFAWISSGEPAVGWGAQTSSRHLAGSRLRRADGSMRQEQPVPEGTPGAVYRPWGIDQGKRTPYLLAAVAGLIEKVAELEAKTKQSLIMGNDIAAGHTYSSTSPNNAVTASNLNEHVNQRRLADRDQRAVGEVALLGAEELLNNDGGTLKKATVNTLATFIYPDASVDKEKLTPDIIHGQTTKASPTNSDEILIWDAVDSAEKDELRQPGQSSHWADERLADCSRLQLYADRLRGCDPAGRQRRRRASLVAAEFRYRQYRHRGWNGIDDEPEASGTWYWHLGYFAMARTSAAFFDQRHLSHHADRLHLQALARRGAQRWLQRLRSILAVRTRMCIVKG